MLKTLHNQLYTHKFKLYNMVGNICYITRYTQKILTCYIAYNICYI